MDLIWLPSIWPDKKQGWWQYWLYRTNIILQSGICFRSEFSICACFFAILVLTNVIYKYVFTLALAPARALRELGAEPVIPAFDFLFNSQRVFHVVLITVMDLTVGSNWKGHIKAFNLWLFSLVTWLCKIIPCDDLSLLRHQVAVVLGNHENYYYLTTTTNTVPYSTRVWLNQPDDAYHTSPCHGTACLCECAFVMHAVGVVSFAPTVPCQ